ncbi:hypothetical protein NDU88_006913 [Pleurodeles waltl]|uniref:Uncharacterized protein n=1 Tax=Pleurodeles waltl TaxID=8319 RepID=A0AAV7MFE2_PLEWA|nr:hypothetical protein NDU88_006913 [Pleurodeles waltl]
MGTPTCEKPSAAERHRQTKRAFFTSEDLVVDETQTRDRDGEDDSRGRGRLEIFTSENSGQGLRETSSCLSRESPGGQEVPSRTTVNDLAQCGWSGDAWPWAENAGITEAFWLLNPDRRDFHRPY